MTQFLFLLTCELSKIVFERIRIGKEITLPVTLNAKTTKCKEDISDPQL